MNGTQKSDYHIEKFSGSCFTTIVALKDLLHKLYSVTLPQSVDIEVEYIVPGDGLCGKQEWLCENSDLKKIYTQYKGRKEIVLWCFPNNVKFHSTHSKKGKVSSAKSCRKSPYDSQ